MGDNELVNILIVDDVVQNLVVLREVLSHPDYGLVTATSGREALRCLLNDDFALVLLDVAMPGMDGFELAKAIKSRPRSSDVPIIFLTALKKDIANVYQGYSTGAVDYLEKPLDPEVVKAKVAVFVELYRKKQELVRKNEQIARQAELLRESERREQEYRIAELKRASDLKYRNLVDLIPKIVWRATPAGEAEYFSGRWVSATGVEAERAKGNGWLAVLHPDDLPAFERLWLRSVHSAENFETECRLRGENGGYRWFLCQALPEEDAEGHVSNWLGTFTDIQAQKQIDEERQELLRQAQEAVSIRDEFLSVASHELKTPLTTLQLQLQMLQNHFKKVTLTGSRPERVFKTIDTLIRQNERLDVLVNDLLDVSRMTAGQLELEPKSFDITQLVQEVIERYGESVAGGPDIRFEQTEKLTGKWDRSRLDQVFTNLLSNAIKYGQGKPIAVEVREESDFLVMSVRDHGIGISDEDRRRIFDRFERAVSNRKFTGLGLGLYITNEIVRAHGGRIQVESEQGCGSTFSVWLPLESVPKVEAEQSTVAM